jgi:hypothetical protein
MNYSCQFLTFLFALGLGAHVEVDGLRSSMMDYRELMLGRGTRPMGTRLLFSEFDDFSDEIDLDFDFPFQGSPLNSIAISSKGLIVPGGFSHKPRQLEVASANLDKSMSESVEVYTMKKNIGSSDESLLVSWEADPELYVGGGLINAQAELFMNGRVNMRYANMENPEEVSTVSQFLNIGNHYLHNGNSHYSQNGNNRFERNGNDPYSRNGNDHYSQDGNDHYSQNANDHYSQNGNVHYSQNSNDHYSQSGNDTPFASHDELFEMFEDSFERGFPVHEGSRRHYTGAYMP